MKKKLLAMSVMAAISSQANAFQFDTPDDWQIRWDNTVKANIMARVAAQDDDVITDQARASWFIADDADLSVDRSGLGLVSTRIDVISEMDVIWKDNWGFRISGSGWYDAMYDDDNNDHPGNRRFTWASPSTPTGEYNHEAEDLHYAGGELLDAFVFGNWEIGDTSLGIRAGRHTIYWGNGLLTNGALHGFGGAMAPVDFNKALSVPGSEAKELFMPTGKISTVFQPTDNLTLNAYYSYEFQAYRVPETGTYWSPAEGLSEDTEIFVIVNPLLPFPTEDNRFALKLRGYTEDEGDYGFNVQYYIERWALETSFIYINYTDKNLHGLVAGLGTPNTPASLPDAGVTFIGEGKWVFKNDIDAFGISLAKEIAGVSVGVDLVRREDSGLAPNLAASLQISNGVALSSWDSDNYPGAVGDTYHVNINALGFLNANWGLWEGGSWILEATFSQLDECNKNCAFLDDRVSEGRWISQVDMRFRPTWYQVRPGWDMTLPMSFTYTIDGEKAPFSFAGDEEAGSASIGVQFDIDQKWLFTAAYNARFGPVLAGIGGLLKDRDNISLTLKRTW